MTRETQELINKWMPKSLLTLLVVGIITNLAWVNIQIFTLSATKFDKSEVVNIQFPYNEDKKLLHAEMARFNNTIEVLRSQFEQLGQLRSEVSVLSQQIRGAHLDEVSPKDVLDAIVNLKREVEALKGRQ